MSADASGDVVDAGEQLRSAAAQDLVVDVLRGRPEDDEVVALVAALAVLRRRAASGGDVADDPASSRWRYGAGLRAPMPSGPDAWRVAAR